MSTIIDCPSCSRKLRVPDELTGQKVKCPTCNGIFALVDEPPGESLPPAPAGSETVPTVELEEQSVPSPARPPEESVPTESKHRDEELDDDRPWEREYRPYHGVRRDSEPHRASLVLTLGILSIVLSATTLLSVIGLALGITAWIMGYRDKKKMQANQMDPQGFGNTQAGFICGIIGTSLGSICSLYCLGHLAVMGFFMVGASRMTPPPTKTTPAPIPKKAPAKPGKGSVAGGPDTPVWPSRVSGPPIDCYSG